MGERDNIEVDKLRGALLSETVLKHAKFLEQVEKEPSRIFAIPVEVDDTIEVYRFRRLTHEQASRIFTLPIFDKMIANEKMTEQEERMMDAFQLEMVIEVAVDNKKWEAILQTRPVLIPVLYNIVSHFSGMTEEFQKGLADFVNEDFGFNYGYVWFQMFRLTPSQVAQLPETDVLLVQKWVEAWYKRLEQNAGRA